MEQSDALSFGRLSHRCRMLPQGERRSKISLKKFGVSAPLRFCGLYVKKRPLSQKVSFFTTEAQRSGNAEFFNAFALHAAQTFTRSF